MMLPVAVAHQAAAPLECQEEPSIPMMAEIEGFADELVEIRRDFDTSR